MNAVANLNPASTLFASILLAILIGVAPKASLATTYYVTTNGVGNGSSWEQATNSIQGAIDRAMVAGDIVLVSNGVYEADSVTGATAGSSLPSRILIPRAITVRSASNDPTQAIIRGRRASNGLTNGTDAVRCAYLAVSGAKLIGFTLTNGATRVISVPPATDPNEYGGGAYCQSGTAILSNCIIAACSADKKGGGIYGGQIYDSTIYGGLALYGGGADGSMVSNCTVRGNVSRGNGGGTYQGSVYHSTIIDNSTVNGGGGTYAGTIYDSTIISNSSPSGGGGTTAGTLYRCTLVGNRSIASNSGIGGGVSGATLYNCILTNNLGVRAGGAHNSTMYNCELIGNVSSNYAGGAWNGTFYNCLFTGNRTVISSSDGGGGRDAVLYNCTVVSNTAVRNGGGIWGGTVINTIIYGNTAGTANANNWVDGNVVNVNTIVPVIFTNSCTTPAQVGWAAGNRAEDPRFEDAAAGDFHLRESSPCINTGLNFPWMSISANVHSRDLDGQPRIRHDLVDMGAYEALLNGTCLIIR